VKLNFPFQQLVPAAVPLALFLPALALSPARAASVASDDASNYSSFGTYSASNLGSGFGAWTITGTDGNSSHEGTYLDTGSKAISVSTKSWGFYANSGQMIDAVRLFTGSLSAGQTFQVDLQFDGIGNGTGHSAPPGNGSARQAGFELRSGSTARFRFYFIGGAGNCAFDDNAGNNISIGTGGFPSGGFRVVFKLLTADTYEFAVVSPNSGTIIYGSGARTLMGTAGSGLDRVDLYDNDNQDGSSGNCYFNSLKIGYDAPAISAQPSATTTACQNSPAAFSVIAASTDGSSLTYAWRKRGMGWGNAWTFNTNGGNIFLASSPEIDSGGKAWGLQQTTASGGACEALRPLPAALAANQTLSVDFDNKNITAGNSVGLSLQDAGGTNAFEYFFSGGGANYSINDSSSSARNTGMPFTSGGLNLKFTLTGAANYSLTVTRLSDKATMTLTGNVIAGRSIQRVRFFCFQSGAGNNVYFNNLVVAGADDNAGNYSSWSGDKGQKPLTDGPTGNGSTNSGTATASYSILNAQAADDASYDCAVISGQGYTTISSGSALTVNSSPSITTLALPAVSIGVPYSQTLQVSGGTAPYSFAVSSGALPAGLNLGASSGTISGTYNGPAGTSNFTVTVTDSSSAHCAGYQAYALSLVNCPAISLSPATLPDGMYNMAYSQTLSANGGAGPYTFSLLSGLLPAGLSLSSAGVLSGTPSVPGTSTLTVLATDTNGCSGNLQYSLTIDCPAITLSPGSPLPGGTVGAAYSQTLSAGGGAGPYLFAKSTGTLPPGVSLSAAGVLAGTPTLAGTYNFTVTATDTNGCAGNQGYSVTMTCPAITLSPASLPFGVSNVSYSAVNNVIAASGGTGPYGYAVTSGALPPGLTLNSTNGTFTGTPSSGGLASFTVTATDADGCTGNQNYTLSVGVAPSTTDPLPQAICPGTTASFAVVGSGSTPLAYGWRKRGTGWGAGNAWTFVHAGCNGTHGYYVGDSTACGGISPGINSPGANVALGLYANSGDDAEVTRGFSALQPGQSVVLDYQNPRDMSSAGAGTIAVFGLRDSGGTARFELYFNGGDTQYTLNDLDPLVNRSGIPYTAGGLHLVFTLVDADHYNLQVTRLSNGTVFTYVGRTLMGTAGNSISQMRVFYRNSGSGGNACQDFFVNNFIVGGYSDGAGNYSAGGCGTTTWSEGSNNGAAPLIDGGRISGSATPTLQISNTETNDDGTYDVVAYNAFGAVRCNPVGTLTVQDTNAPSVTLLGDNPLTNECHAAFVDPGATASDDCPGVVSLVTNSTVNPNAPGSYVIQYIATDAAGNSATNTRAVYVVDTIPPVVTLSGPAALTVECHSSFTDPGATASDTCAGNLAVLTSGSVNPNAPGVYVLGYSATDPSGNTGTNSRTVTVVDTTPPVIAWSFTNLTLGADDQCEALMPDVTGTNYILASDTCSSVLISQMPTNNTVLALGTNVVVLAVADSSGNVVYSTNTVVVADTTPPVVTLLGDNTLTNECHTAFVDPGATATDNCSGVVSLVTNSTVNPNAPGSYIIQYIATDAAGNSATNTREIYVVDTTPPVVTLSGAATLTVECHSSFIDPGATASDTCAGNLSVITSGSVNPNAPGVYVLGYSATDPSSNIGTNSRTVTVVDTTPPVIAWSFTNLTLSADDQCQALMPDVTGTNYILASDTCSSVSISQMPTNNAVLALGTNVVVLAVADASGNMAYSTNTVVVADTTPPVVTLLGGNPLTNECHTAFVDPGATATDNCSGVVSLVTNSTVNPNAPGSYIIQYIATDAAGNSATNTRAVYVVDTTPPVISSCAPPQTITAGYAGAAILPDFTGLVAASDACSGSVNILQQPPPGTHLSVGDTPLIFYADDGNGNTNTCSTTVTVKPAVLVPPVILGQRVLADGSFQLTFSGPDGEPYRVQATTALLTGSWVVLTNGTFAGTATFTDTGATNFPSRFYRVAAP
jgi:hypothetical protein